VTACPTPDKIRHATEGKAWGHVRELRRVYGARADVVPYRCDCGAWHVGHSQVALSKRIRAALRRERP
jgi:hypothetical protein